jgi:hypothetical protein
MSLKAIFVETAESLVRCSRELRPSRKLELSVLSSRQKLPPNTRPE